MKRKEFLKLTGIGCAASVIPINAMNMLFNIVNEEKEMPVLFIGHGSPVNAIESNKFSNKWNEIGQKLPRPEAILCVSAHWITRGQTKLLAVDSPKMIYDFSGFEKELYKVKYPAKGSPKYAKLTKSLVKSSNLILEDEEWGYDHACWVPLVKMYPYADIPVYLMSVDMKEPAEYHFKMASELKELRKKGVLVIGTGNVVHNLREISYKESDKYEWAEEFDEKIAEFVSKRDSDGIVNYLDYGKIAFKSVPTAEHFLPLIYSIALTDNNDNVEIFNKDILHGSVSMTSFLWSK